MTLSNYCSANFSFLFFTIVSPGIKFEDLRFIFRCISMILAPSALAK